MNVGKIPYDVTGTVDLKSNISKIREYFSAKFGRYLFLHFLNQMTSFLCQFINFFKGERVPLSISMDHELNKPHRCWSTPRAIISGEWVCWTVGHDAYQLLQPNLPQVKGIVLDSDGLTSPSKMTSERRIRPVGVPEAGYSSLKYGSKAQFFGKPKHSSAGTVFRLGGMGDTRAFYLCRSWWRETGYLQICFSPRF